MAEERKAGELILSKFEIFNEAVVLFETVIQPAIDQGVDKCVASFGIDNDWFGEYDFESDKNCWIAPKSWAINDEDDKPNYKAWFHIDCINSNNDYWTATFCGIGTENGEAGFLFAVDPKSFGGKNAWNAYTKLIDQKLISQLTAIGFRNMDKGKFFLPVRLDISQLGKSWLEYGEFSNDDDSLAPLSTAMAAMKQSVPIFDAIMGGWNMQRNG